MGPLFLVRKELMLPSVGESPILGTKVFLLS